MGEKGARFSDAVGELADELVGRFAELGEITWRKMFGGAGVFVDGAMFALIDSDARLFLKGGDGNRNDFVAAGGVKHGRMPYYSVPDAVLDDEAVLLEWARGSAALAAGGGS